MANPSFQAELDALRDTNAQILAQMATLVASVAEIAARQDNSKGQPPPEGNSSTPPLKPEITSLMAKLNSLEESIQNNGKVAALGVDMKKLNLFPEVIFPEKFKYPDITKFDGSQDPRTHLVSYVGAMSMHKISNDGMAKLFHQSLTGQALHWFLTLGEQDKASWDAMAKAFVNQYNYNFELEITTRELEATRMEANEPFVDFVRRWREKAAMVFPKLSDKEQIRLISKCLQPHFARHMLYAQTLVDFPSYYQQGLIVESAIHEGLVERPDNPDEDQTNYLSLYSDSGSTYADPSSPNASSSHQAASSNHQAEDTRATEPVNQISARNLPSKQPRQLPPLNIPQDVIFQRLAKEGILKPLQPTPRPAEQSPNRHADKYCEYHQGTGHTTLTCFKLAHKIRDLINDGTIPPPPKPNTVHNPMPQHQNSQVDPLSFTESHDPDPTSSFYQ